MDYNKKTLIYKVDIRNIPGEEVEKYLISRKETLLSQVKGQYKPELDRNALSVVVIPNNGDSAIELIDLNFEMGIPV